MRWGCFVRHFGRHQRCSHDKRLYLIDIREKMVPGAGLDALAGDHLRPDFLIYSLSWQNHSAGQTAYFG